MCNVLVGLNVSEFCFLGVLYGVNMYGLKVCIRVGN